MPLFAAFHTNSWPGFSVLMEILFPFKSANSMDISSSTASTVKPENEDLKLHLGRGKLTTELLFLSKLIS